MPRSSSLIRRTIAASLLLAAAVPPGRAFAAACCASATSFGIGRLRAWEDWAAGVQLGHARSLGQWDSQASLRWNGSDFSDGITTAKAWAIVRLHDRVELQGWIPVVVEDRHSPTQSQIAGGLGDVGAGVRFEVLKIGEYEWLPSLAVTAGALAPTGKRIEETSPPLFAGTTGRGVWGGSLSVEAEHAFLPWFVKLDAGVTGYLPFNRPDTGERQQYGRVLQAMLSTGREIIPNALVAAVAITGEWEGSIAVDGAALPRSRAYQYTLAGSLAWQVTPRWTLVGSVTNDVWPDGAGMNRDALLGFTLGVRHGHF